MKQRKRRLISAALALVLLAALWPGAVLAQPAWDYLEPPTSAGLAMAVDQSTANPGDTVSFTVSFNLLSGIITGYNTTRVALFLPAGLDYSSSILYVNSSPAVLSTYPAATPAGTSLVVDLNNDTAGPGPAQLVVAARVGDGASGYLTARAELYLQQAYAEMPAYPNEQATAQVRIAYQPPVEPITPQIFRVTFNLNGGSRVGGGALSQAVPTGGAAVEPYVFRQGYILQGWDRTFYNVQYDMTVTAQWSPGIDTGPITVEPPIYQFVEGHFVNGRNSFTQSSHMPLIFYAQRHLSNFTNVEIDGRTLATGTSYVATTGIEAGTTAIHLKASYLNNLTAGTHTLRVNFRDGAYANAQFTIQSYVNTFYDVSASDWFYTGVGAMNASELLRGVSAAQFDPYSYMTRGMVVTLLYRFAGEPSVAGFRNPFPDVAAGQYYTNAVIWASANGMVLGHESGMFAPNDTMTHEQFAAVLYRYQSALGTTPMDILADRSYNDFDQISPYARDAVNKLTAQGVFRDWPYDPGNRFEPQAPVTRAAVATVMRLWIESIGW